MNGKQRKILISLFAEPPSGTIECLLMAVGCNVVEGSGSRVRFVYGSEIETFHRPHPAKEAKRYQMAAARDFLIRIPL